MSWEGFASSSFTSVKRFSFALQDASLTDLRRVWILNRRILDRDCVGFEETVRCCGSVS